MLGDFYRRGRLSKHRSDTNSEPEALGGRMKQTRLTETKNGNIDVCAGEYKTSTK